MEIIPAYNINIDKWDDCVSANGGLIYATTTYLNVMTDNWSGLVINDYETVMPLPWRRKWGIRYLYTPSFMQQLGWIGKSRIDLNVLNQLLDGFIQYGDYLFNSTNHFYLSTETLTPKCNCILDLSKDYQQIQLNYSKELIGYLKKAKKNGLIVTNTDVSFAVDAYKKLYSDRFSSTDDLDYQHFIQLCNLLEKQGKAFARKVIDENEKRLAIGLFLKDNNRIYNLMPSTYPEGRKLCAMHFLLDTIFHENAGKQLIFDFEGSDHPGIKQFYQLFGSTEESYMHWHFNHLPRIIKIIKK